MATTASPRGLVPVKVIGGRAYVGSTRLYNINSGESTAIFTGDIVKLHADGYVQKDTGTTTATPAGVFLGCTYTDPNLKYVVHRQYWPANTVASDAKAYVADDPDLIFEVQADGAVAATALNANIPIIQGSGSTVTGVSGVKVDASDIANTNSLPLRIVGFVNRPGSTAGDTYTDLLVVWNAGMHMIYRDPDGQA